MSSVDRKSPKGKLLDRIQKVPRTGNKDADKLQEKALKGMNTTTDALRDDLSNLSNFLQRVFLETDNRVSVLGAKCDEYRTIDERVYKAIETGQVINLGEEEDPTRQGKENSTFSGRSQVAKGLQVQYNKETKVVEKLAKDGSKTPLNWRELLALKTYIFGENATDIDAGHETAVATQKLEVSLNVWRQIEALAPDPEQKAKISEVIRVTEKILELLDVIDKLKSDTLQVIKKASGGKGGLDLVNAFVTFVLQNPQEVKYGTASTDAVDFTAEAVGKTTLVTYEDGELNKTKGRMAGQLVSGLNAMIFSILEGSDYDTNQEKTAARWTESGNSLSMMDAVELNILYRAAGKRFPGVKKRYKPVKQTSTILKKRKRLRLNPTIKRSPIPKAARKKDAFAEVGRLMGFVNAKLPQQIISNMGRPSLQNQTGTFAQSAKVTSALPAGPDSLVLNYTYDNRYRGFENNSKYPLEYDPRGLIGKSIRELAITQAQFKFITRRV